MLSLLKICCKEGLYSSRMVLIQGLLMIGLILHIKISNVAFIFFLITALPSMLIMTLKTKEKQEGWRNLFFTLAGPDRRFATYLHFLMLIIGVVFTLIGTGTLFVVAQYGAATFSISEILVLVGAVNGTVFYYQLQLLIAEFLLAEHIIHLQQISIISTMGLVFLGKYLGIIPTPLVLIELSIVAALFNYYGVFLLAEIAYKRKTRLAIK